MTICFVCPLQIINHVALFHAHMHFSIRIPPDGYKQQRENDTSRLYEANQFEGDYLRNPPQLSPHSRCSHCTLWRFEPSEETAFCLAQGVRLSASATPHNERCLMIRRPARSQVIFSTNEQRSLDGPAMSSSCVLRQRRYQGTGLHSLENETIMQVVDAPTILRG